MNSSVRLDDGNSEGTVHIDVRKLATTRALIQAGSGGGKSYLLRVMMERGVDRVPFIVIDPEGEYRTVREVCSMILVGPGGELPLKPGTGAKAARGILEQGCSAIIDLSELRTRDHSAYVADFLSGIMQAPRKLWRPTIVAIDEAHRFCPESGRDNIAAEQVIDLMSRGRKRGYGGVLLTQRISKIRKDAVAEAANVFVGLTTLDIDIKRAGDTLGIAPAEAKSLRHLDAGQWHAFGPALDCTGVIEFGAKLPRTEAAKEGYEGGPAKNARSLAAIAEMIMESEDAPATLEDAERTIAQLRRELEDAKAEAGPSEDALNAARINAVAHGAGEARAHYECVISDARDKLDAGLALVNEVSQSLWDPPGFKVDPATPSPASPGPTRPRPGGVRQASVPRSSGAATDRVLHALAWWLQAGIDEPGLVQIACIAGMSPKSSTVRGARAALKADGLIEYTGDGTRLTDAGLAAAPSIEKPASLDAWHAAIADRLGGAAYTVFMHLLGTSVPPSLDDVAVATGISPTSSTIRGAVATLRKLGLLAGGQPLRLTDAVYPPGLR